MKGISKQYFRVECNFGCKYFTNQNKAEAYFDRKANKHLDVEMWLVTYCYCEENNFFPQSKTSWHIREQRYRNAKRILNVYGAIR